MKSKKVISSTIAVVLLISIMVLNCVVPNATTICMNDKCYTINYNTLLSGGCYINEGETAKLIPTAERSSTGYFANVVYYCNTTLKKALEIGCEPVYMAKGIASTQSSAMYKGYELYKFVSAYIKYDYDRYYKIINRQNLCDMKTGAQYGWDNKSGVCFEYATLYAAMANSIGLKVRLIYGENHIWNEFYNTQTDKWVFVDCTWKIFNADVNNYHKTTAIHAEF